MKIEFLNVDLEIESAGDLRLLVDELKRECRVMVHDKKPDGNNFAVFGHHSSFPDGKINDILNAFCDALENLSPESSAIWRGCRTRKFDAGFESGNFPNDFQVEIDPAALRRIAALRASVAVTIYPINDKSHSS
ncbi:MAG: hypothetical protein JSS81_26665 [Acidobacteria bacterium]|nr:hypothetical protein [Acidobacteriota bacterium]